MTEQLGALLRHTKADEGVTPPEPVAIGKVDETNLPKPAYINETVLQDPSTHQAYMDIVGWAVLIVGILGGGALVFMFVLAVMDRPIPEPLGGALQWAIIILGVLLVGETLMGKVMTARGGQQ